MCAIVSGAGVRPRSSDSRAMRCGLYVPPWKYARLDSDEEARFQKWKKQSAQFKGTRPNAIRLVRNSAPALHLLHLRKT